MAEAGNGRLAAQFAVDDAARTNVLNRARRCAALTKPWLLPPLGQMEDAKLPENFQSVGSRGITNLEGKMLLALFPPDRPFFQQELAPEIRLNPGIPAEAIQRWSDELFVQDLIAIAMLESSNPDARDYGQERTAGFRTNKRQAISQVIATGDTLERLDDDYRLTVFRRDAYTTRRNSSCDVLYHNIREEVDPLALTEAQFAKTDLKLAEMEAMPVWDRMKPLFTCVQWQPRVRKWMIEQECNGKIVNASDEKVSPFFCTPFEITGGEHYGRGLIEQNLGDLGSLDELNRRVLEFAELCSKLITALDYSSDVREKDMEKPTGAVIRARVIAGVVQDIALLKAEKLADFQVVNTTIERITAGLGKVLLIDSESVRNSERTTAFEVQEVTLRELEGALGGVYAPIADKQQAPLIRRVMYQLRRDKLIKTLPDGATKLRMLTGIAALAKQAQASKLMTFVEVAAKLGDEALRRVDTGVVLAVLSRLQGFREPGVIKSEAKMEQEKQAAMAAAAQMAAAEKAIDVGGNVAEAQMTGKATAAPAKAA